MTKADVDEWVRRYTVAWDSNDPADIGALFTDDADYFTAPFRQPWRGQEAIVDGWLGRKDQPGDHEYRYEVIAIDGQLGFVSGRTHYVSETLPDYANLWIIRLMRDGRASSFTEWWMEER